MIYLDNAATSWPKPEEVKEAVLKCFDQPLGNYGRASHHAARTANRIVFKSRETLALFFGVTDSSRVIFTGNGTQSLNMALRSSIRSKTKILASPLEHDAVMKPLVALAGQQNISFFKIDPSGGEPDWDDFNQKLRGCSLLATTAVSNVTGLLLPWKEMAALAESSGIPSIIDGSQLAGKRPVNLEKLNLTTFCCSGHKGLLGPAGTGLLIRSVSGNIKPLILGGTGSSGKGYPEYLEPGTHNLSGIAGLCAGVDYLLTRGMSDITEVYTRHIEYLKQKISCYRSLEITGSSAHQTGILSFRVAPSHADSLGRLLDQKGIAQRSGIHCNPSAHTFYGTMPEGTFRISPGLFTTTDEIDTFLDVLGEFLQDE
jgi:selenocysteine lyase/cysteine desulfurase